MNKDIAQKWYKQAAHDLKMAKKNIAIGGFDIAAFLAHQAVEKLLKSIFAFEGKAIPKIHHVDVLAQQLKLPEDLFNDVADLTVDYMYARYPDVADHLPFEEYDEKIATEKVKKARKVFKELKKHYEFLRKIK